MWSDLGYRWRGYSSFTRLRSNVVQQIFIICNYEVDIF